MKLLYFCLLITVFSNAQTISPYYPSEPMFDGEETQFTFFEYNYVSVRIQNFLSNNMDMTFVSDDYIVNDPYTKLRLIFKKYVSQDNQRLKFDFILFNTDDKLIIKSVKITGDYELLALFFVKYWNTTLQFSDTVGENPIAYSYYLQDKAEFIREKNSYAIVVNNSTIRDVNNFITDFNAKKISYQKELDDHQEKKRLENEKKDSIAKENFIKKNTRYAEFEYSVIKRKNKLEIKRLGAFPDSYVSQIDIQEELAQFLINYKNGGYLINVGYTIFKDKVSDVRLKIVN